MEMRKSRDRCGFIAWGNCWSPRVLEASNTVAGLRDVPEYQPDRDSFECTRAVGDPSESLTGLVISNGDRVTGWAGANRQIAVNSDAVLDLGHSLNFLALLCVEQSAVLSTLMVRHPRSLRSYCDREQGFDKIHIDALEQVSASVALRLRERQESEVLI